MNRFDTYKIAGTLALLSLWGATSCKKTPIAEQLDPAVVSFSLKTAKTGMQNAAASRAIGDDEFLSFSMLGMFADESPVTSVVGRKYSNVGYENPTGTSVWRVPQGADPIYFPQTDVAMDFYAYHPYSSQTPTATSFTSGNTWVNYTLPKSQSTKAELKTADLLWGRAVERKRGQGTVNLEFYHKLSKLSLSIKKGSDWGTETLRLSSIRVSGTNVLDQAKLDLLSGTLEPVTGGATSVECTLSPSQTLSVLNEFACDFILIPAPAKDIALTFTYDGSSGKSEAILTSGLVFKSGTQLNVRVTINKFSPTELSISPTMTDWNFTSQVEVDGI